MILDLTEVLRGEELLRAENTRALAGGLFEQPGLTAPDEQVARMYHSAWEVAEITDLVRARQRLVEAGALVGSSDHGVSLSLYAKDPDGLEFEIFWTVPGGASVRTRPLDLDGELARRGIVVG